MHKKETVFQKIMSVLVVIFGEYDLCSGIKTVPSPF